VATNGLAPDDRTYLAQIVSARTGMSMDDAQKRVDDVVNRTRANVTQAADAARKAGAYLSFWTFMSLLFGAACATLGGMLGALNRSGGKIEFVQARHEEMAALASAYAMFTGAALVMRSTTS